VSGLATEGRGIDFHLREPSRKRGLFCSGAIIKTSNLTGEIHGSRNCISVGIRPEAIESPI
jgi:hypothetical protein